MNENIKGGFIRLLPDTGSGAERGFGERWVKASSINRVDVNTREVTVNMEKTTQTYYAVQAGLEYFQCSNDPFPLIAEMNGEPF